MRRLVKRAPLFHDPPRQVTAAAEPAAPVTQPDDHTDIGFDWSPAEVEHLSIVSVEDVRDTAAWLKRIGMNEAAALLQS